MKQKRLLTVGVTLFAAASMLAACGSNTADQSSSSDSGSGSSTVELTLWGTYGAGSNSAQKDALEKEIIPAFEKANPGITIKYVDMPYDGLKQKLTTGAAAGELPDLIRTDLGWNAQFAKLGVLKQLDGNMPNYDALAAKVYPGLLGTTLYNGHHYGLPLDTNTRVLISNPDALSKLGVDKAPETFDELKDLATKAKDAGGSVYAFADGDISQWNIMPWIWSAGGDISDPDQTKASGYLDSDKSVAGVQFLVDLYKEGQIPNAIIGNEGATKTQDGMPNGEYATILDGPWMDQIWAGSYPDFKPTYSKVPAGEGGSISVVGGESIVITEQTKDLEASYKFLEFTQSREFQLPMSKAGQMTVVAEYAAEEAEATPGTKIFSEQLKTAKSRLSIPDSGKVDEILKTELTPAFEGKVTVKEALTKAAQQIDPLLSAAK